MSKVIYTSIFLLGVAACSSGSANEAPATSGASAGRGVTQRSLAAGAQVEATMLIELSSQSDSVGQTVQAVVSHDVTNHNGTVVIPAGSTVFLRVVALEPAQDQGDNDGRVTLAAGSVEVRGTAYPLVASVDQVAFTLEGRGITKAEAARIGAGTAAGAIVGQVIGKNTRSTVIGGAVGTVAGTAVALRYAKRDVVVAAGTPVVLTLTQPLSVFAK